MGGRGARSATATIVNRSESRRPGDLQGFHAKQIRELGGDSYEDGTYNLETMQPVSYSSGYQVTFCQIGDNYTAEEYAEKVGEFLGASSDGVTSAGKFGGTPEISFNVADRETAVALARKYNQISIWDWAVDDQIETGGTGAR